jgi:hypothetical protein
VRRSAIWCAAFALAWRQLKNHCTFPDQVEGLNTWDNRIPTPPAEIARWCAAEADACESAYVAAFGPIE